MMTKNDCNDIDVFVSNFNNAVSDIENGRFKISCDNTGISGRRVMFNLTDTKTGEVDTNFIRWYVIRCKDKTKIYPPELFSWANDFIVERRTWPQKNFM